MVFKEFRTQRNLTQAQAGDLFGISGAYWAELESGKGNQRKLKQYGLALSYIDNPQIYNEIDPDAVKKQTAHYRYAEIESLTGFSAATWQTLKHNTHLSEKKWRVLVNAALLELTAQQSKSIVKIEPEQQEFDHPFSISTIRNHKDENGTLWFCLVDVCKTIDYTNPQNSLSIIDGDEVQKIYYTDSYNREQELIFISEAGLNEFLCNTTVPKAKPFKKWVYKEVLPTIRKTGTYSVQQMQPESASIGLADLARLIGLRSTQIEQDFNAKIEQLEAKIESRLENLPAQSISVDEVVQETIKVQQSLKAKWAELHNLVISIVNAAKALPSDDPEAQYYSKYVNAWRTVHRHARPPVSCKDDYMTNDQIQHAIDGGRLILARLGGSTQLAIDLGAA